MISVKLLPLAVFDGFYGLSIGLVNAFLMKWGWISTPINFWANATTARVLIILINLWIGIPYTMLIVPT